MKKIILIIFLLLVFPNISDATICSDTGYTVVFLNGVLNKIDKAEESRDLLSDRFKEFTKRDDVIFKLGYNPSHLGGLGDAVQVVSQAIGTPVSNFDRDTILKQIHPEVTTRKILLVGHSQGTFYTNELYDYLTNNGVPKESIAVYNLASPASFVSGDGPYLTSENDNLIKRVREWTVKFGISEPLPTNETIPLSIYAVEAGELWRGHAFSREYLAGAPFKIISTITSELGGLVATETSSVSEGCFNLPPETISYRMQKEFFTIGDTLAVSAVQSGKAAKIGALAIADAIKTGVLYTSGAINNAIDLLASTAGSKQTATATLSSEENQRNKNSSETKPLAKVSEKSVFANPPPPENGPDSGKDSTEDTSVSNQNDDANPDAETESQPNSPRLGPGAGFGGGAPKPAVIEESSTDQAILSAPMITSPAGSSVIAASTVTFAGTASSSLAVSNDFSSASTSADADGNWSLSISDFPQGTTTIKFFASSGIATSAPASLSFFVDSVGPDLSLTAGQCASSLSPSGCLLATTTVLFEWSSNDSELAYFSVDKNGSFSTTTATTTSVTAANNSSYTFSVSAADKHGNKSATSSQEVVISTSPVVINEVAWAGTGASANDEWVELYNPTNLPVSLGGWVFRAEDGVPYINLSGSIPARGYYLIERSDENTVSDVAANLVVAFSGVGASSGLSNSGENLFLEFSSGGATTTMDNAPKCGATWCGGVSSINGKFSMERRDSLVAGTDQNNWGTNIGTIKNGRDSAGGAINGTPKARNYVSYLVNKNGNITSNLTLTEANSPYLVDDATISISAGTSLTIEPGVVIKFYAAAGFSADGNITARGTAAKPIVFTSFYDDTYGGDINGSFGSTSPSYGDWNGVNVLAQSADSVFDYAVFRYGGKSSGSKKSNLYFEGASPSVSNSTFEYSKEYGLRLYNASSTVSNSTFGHNKYGALNSPANVSYGLYSEGGQPTISNNTFSDNQYGLYLINSPATASGNTFTQNSEQAFYSIGTLGGGSVGDFSGNTGSGNGINGITIQGNLTQTNGTSTLSGNSLPYYHNGPNTPTVVASSTLVIESGVVIKGLDNVNYNSRILINGELLVNGVSEGGVIFTSAKDDSDGSDVFGDGAVGVPGLTDWWGIEFGATASSSITGTTFKYSKKALSYGSTPIKLNTVRFSNNALGISANSDVPILEANGVAFDGNTATSTINLF